MPGDPTLRLAALLKKDVAMARELLAEAVRPHCLDVEAALDTDEAIEEFQNLVERAITFGSVDVTLSVEIAELVALALKSRVRVGRRGRPPLSRSARLRNEVAITTAKAVKARKKDAGIRGGLAEEEAATELANAGGSRGYRLSPNTIARRLRNGKKK